MATSTMVESANNGSELLSEARELPVLHPNTASADTTSDAPAAEDARDAVENASVPRTNPANSSPSPAPSVPAEASSDAAMAEDSSMPVTAPSTLSDLLGFSVDEASEIGRLWRAVLDDGSDFTSWTLLLELAEQSVSSDIEMARQAFERFLRRYPYCYGYWKKFADAEKMTGHPERVIEVYENGVNAIYLSIDLWVAYLEYLMETSQTSPDYEEKVKTLFERAIASAGLEFRSDKLWEDYINWLSVMGNFVDVTAVYDKLLGTPTQLYYQHWESFKRHVEEKDLRQIVAPEEFKGLLREVTQHDIDINALIDDGTIKKMKEKLVAKRSIVYQANYEQISKRWYFEEKIRRPYFHIKPLERGQLSNWREYLDMEILEQDHARIIVLFERCLIACARYEEFWIKYAKYLEWQRDIDGARNVWQRACLVHLPHRPTVHWYYSAFEERQGQDVKASEIMRELETMCPKQTLVTLRRISCLRRIAQPDQVVQSYEEALQRYSDCPASHSLISAKFSRYLHRIRADWRRAATVLKTAIGIDPANERLHTQLVDLAYQLTPLDETYFCDCIDLAVRSDHLNVEAKLRFLCRKMEFLEDFSADIKKITDAYDDYQSMLATRGSGPGRVVPGAAIALDNGSGGGDLDETTAAKRARRESYTGGSYDPLSNCCYGEASVSNTVTTAASSSALAQQIPVYSDGYDTGAYALPR